MGAPGTLLPLPQPGFQPSSRVGVRGDVHPAPLAEGAPGKNPPSPSVLQGHLGKMRSAEIRGKGSCVRLASCLTKLSSGQSRSWYAVLGCRGDSRIFRPRCGLGWGIERPGSGDFRAAPLVVFAVVGSWQLFQERGWPKGKTFRGAVQ